MKRWWPAGVAALILLAAGISLGRPAVNPADFSGRWYCPEENRPYLFDSGLILGDSDGTFCGAYSYSGGKVLLFLSEADGLQTEKELYLVQSVQGDVLCENEDGSGKIYFSRNG